MSDPILKSLPTTITSSLAPPFRTVHISLGMVVKATFASKSFESIKFARSKFSGSNIFIMRLNPFACYKKSMKMIELFCCLNPAETFMIIVLSSIKVWRNKRLRPDTIHQLLKIEMSFDFGDFATMKTTFRPIHWNFWVMYQLQSSNR